MPTIPILKLLIMCACFTALESATSFPLLQLEEQAMMVGFVRLGTHPPIPRLGSLAGLSPMHFPL